MPYYRCPVCGLTSYSAAAYSTASLCPSCSVSLPDDAKLDLAPGAARRFRRVLRARPEAVSEARGALVGFALPEIARERLAVIVSELVTNSVRHAGLSAVDPISIYVTNRGGRVRLAVHDGGRGFALPSPDGRDLLATSGQGLVIVAALSETWGVDCDRDGCTVWCELALHDERAAAVEREVTTGYVRELAIELGRPVGPTPAY
jgi:anti-sigma regulatory factor (Ser/Thr protein kinase)